MPEQLATGAVPPILIVAEEGKLSGANADQPLRCSLHALLDKVFEYFALSD